MGFTHDPEDEDASYAEFRFTFDRTEGVASMGAIESHIHSVNPQSLVESLVYAATMVLTASMPDSIPEMLKDSVAKSFIKAMLEAGSGVVPFTVPADASGLFDE